MTQRPNKTTTLSTNKPVMKKKVITTTVIKTTNLRPKPFTPRDIVPGTSRWDAEKEIVPDVRQQPQTTRNRNIMSPIECAVIPPPTTRTFYLNPETGKFEDTYIRGAGMIRFNSLPPSKDGANPNMIFEFIEKLMMDKERLEKEKREKEQQARERVIHTNTRRTNTRPVIHMLVIPNVANRNRHETNHNRGF